MKLVCSLPPNLQISAVKNFVDGILLEDKENIVEEIITATAYGLIPIYKLNEMVFPEEIEEYKNKIIKTKNTSCLYNRFRISSYSKGIGAIESNDL